jgi:polynucleotide 5'-hydroxyl-kinase GRC3/NOL9
MSSSAPQVTPARPKRQRSRSASPPYTLAVESLIRAPSPSRKTCRSQENNRRRRRLAVVKDDTGKLFDPTLDVRNCVEDTSEMADAKPHGAASKQPFAPYKTPPSLEKDGCVRLDSGNASPCRIFLFNRSISVAGVANVKVLFGALSILSHVLTPESKPARVHSSLGPFIITLVPFQTVRGQDGHRERVLDPSLQPLLLEHIPVLDGECYTVVEISPVGDRDRFHGIGSLIGHATLPFNLPGLRMHSGAADSEYLKGCGSELVPGFCLSTAAKATIFEQWIEWPLVTETLSSRSKLDESKHAQRIIVCGESGTGKSMLARCIVNHLLNDHESVVYVETDVGQPELSPAGLLSAHVVKEPLFGPPASHNCTPPLRAIFFGDTTPRDNPCGYALSVSKIIGYARAYALKHRLPLICNSDGWVSGTGSKLLARIVGSIEPTHVFCSTFRQSQSTGLQSRDTTSDTLPDVLLSTLRSVPPSCSACIVSPLAGKDTVFASSTLRDLGFATYFGSVLTDGYVRSVRLEDINIAFIGEAVPATHVLAALNGSIVALAATLGSSDTLNWSVYGLGLVRGVNAMGTTLYLCTPVADDLIRSCDGLLMSSGIQAPAWLYYACGERFAQKTSNHGPYLTKDVIGNLGPMRSRTTLRRP